MRHSLAANTTISQRLQPAASRVPSVPSPLTLQQLGVVGVGEVEALQGAGDPGEVLPAARARRVQHRGAAGDLRDQHAPVPAVMLCAGEIIDVHHEVSNLPLS